MRIFFALVGAYVLSIFYRSFLTVIAAPLKLDLALNDAQFGALGSIWFFIFALAQFPIGYALDRFGARLTALVPMAIGVAGGVLFSQAQDFNTAAIAMAMIGLGCGPIFMAAVYLFARTSAPGSFSFLVSLFITIGSLGNLISSAPLARLAEQQGWRMAMLGVACVFAIMFLMALLLLRNGPRTLNQKQGEAGFVQGIIALLRIRALWPVIPLTLFGYAVLVTERGLWISPYLKDVLGADARLAGDGAFAMALGMSAGSILYGTLDKRFSNPKRLVSAGTLLAGVTFLMLGFAGHQSLAFSLVSLTLIGAAAFTYALILAHARPFFPDHLIGRGVTAMNFLFIAGGGVMQAITGRYMAAARAAGWSVETIYAWLHIGLGVTLLICLLPYLVARARPEIS
jgi:predicted MFS family arabinose efflux permease